jgi:hypothetical protein
MPCTALVHAVREGGSDQIKIRLVVLIALLSKGYP